MNVPTNAEILYNLITIVNKMNIYKDNDFKHNINKIRIIIDNNVKNKTDKEIIHNFIKNKIDIKPSMIQPVEEIKSLGKFKVKISLHSEVDAEITISVTSADTIQ